MGVGQSPFQAAARPLFLFPINHCLGPAAGDGFLPMGQQAMKMEPWSATTAIAAI